MKTEDYIRKEWGLGPQDQVWRRNWAGWNIQRFGCSPEGIGANRKEVELAASDMRDAKRIEMEAMQAEAAA